MLTSRLPGQTVRTEGPGLTREVKSSGQILQDGTKLGEALHLRLTQIGVDVPPNSRVWHLAKCCESSTDPNEKSRAYEELRELFLAVQHIRAPETWRRTIEAAVAYDPAMPVKGSTAPSRGRDALFELYVAARLSIAGVVVTQGEPDILCQHGTFSFGVAAKRVKSLRKVLPRVRSAADQIRRSERPGVIALDLTPVDETFYGAIPMECAAYFNKRAIGFLSQHCEPLWSQIQRACEGTPVFGVLAFATMRAVSMENGRTIYAAMTHFGRNVSLPGTSEADQMWQIVDALGNRVEF